MAAKKTGKTPGHTTWFKIWARIFILITISLAPLLLIAKPFPAGKPGKDAPLEAFTDYLNERITALMDIYDIPGVNMALIKEGETVWAKAYGYADLASGRKMTTDTYLRVQSISKPVTAWGVMILVEQGRIDLDSPVQQYLKNWKFPESDFSHEKVTVRHLLSHCAGLPVGNFLNYYSPTENIPSLEETLFNEAVLIREPGTSYYYSNTGFNLLELLIEEVSGLDFAAYMAQEVLRPLGMDHSSFNWSKDLKPAVPNGYELTGRAIPVYVYPEKGSGGLFATAGDIAAFAAAGMPDFNGSGQVLTRESINKLYTPTAHRLGIYSLVFDAYGLGYYLEHLPGGKLAVSHGGQGTGWMTHFHSVPESGDGIVILTNSQRRPKKGSVDPVYLCGSSCLVHPKRWYVLDSLTLLLMLTLCRLSSAPRCIAFHLRPVKDPRSTAAGNTGRVAMSIRKLQGPDCPT